MTKVSYSQVHSPTWANPEKTVINCIVKFDHIKPEVPFSASPNDTESHGRLIYQECLAGVYGEIANYIEPPVPMETAASSKTPGLDLSTWPELPRFLEEANSETAKGTIRGIVLVWASMLDIMLGRLIEAFLVDNKISKKMIWDSDRSSFYTFSGRIDIAFALGLIDKKQHENCSHIRRIRNAAAHEWNFNFDNDERVKNAVHKLFESDHSDFYHFQTDPEFLAKMIYASSCAMLINKLCGQIPLAKASRCKEK